MDLLWTKWADRGIKLGSLVKGAVIEDDWGIKKRNTFFLKSIFWENPSGLPYGNPPPFTREAVFRKKTAREFESLQTNSYIQKEKAQRKNPCAFSGAEGETRTLAPVTRPTPLAGAPRHQLEYFCIGSVYDTIRLLKERAENPLSLLSGGESGIRTHGTLPYDGFQDRSVITTSVSLRIRRKL